MLRMGPDGGDTPRHPKDDITCGDILREWIKARDAGEAALDHASCAPSRVAVLFVGRDNHTVSVAAEAIFTHLCSRRKLDCFSSHSAGTRVSRDGRLADGAFVNALWARGIDVGRKMACSVHRCDVESYSLVVCMDEHTRSELLYMVTDEQGRFSEEQEKRIVVLSEYCSKPALRAMQFQSGEYARETVDQVIGMLTDACHGLLAALIENPPIPQS